MSRYFIQALKRIEALKVSGMFHTNGFIPNIQQLVERLQAGN